VKPDLGTQDGKMIYGLSKGPIVWMRQDIMDSHPVDSKNECLQHEFEHVRQAWSGLIVFHMLLLYIPKYRAWCEKKAMEVQEDVE
jgi:hypothetical protein